MKNLQVAVVNVKAKLWIDANNQLKLNKCPRIRRILRILSRDIELVIAPGNEINLKGEVQMYLKMLLPVANLPSAYGNRFKIV